MPRHQPTLILAVLMAAAGGCTHAESPGGSGQPGADRSGAESTGPWRDTFSVDKARLVSIGRGSFWILEPGRVWTFRDGPTTLTLSVLDQTRLVDGVTTRVVEEREDRNGVPIEISRNYLALDPSTGDVYYFGEEVDMYKGGKVSDHAGSWLSGSDGAQFGLLIPGRPRPGDRFQNEIAPGVAMDRGEVVSVNERVVTPAGTFENCVHIMETTPLDGDVSHKWYAPGKGLVRDGRFVLASVGGEGGG